MISNRRHRISAKSPPFLYEFKRIITNEKITPYSRFLKMASNSQANLSSNRAFGFLFSTVLLFVSFWKLYHNETLFFSVSFVFFVILFAITLLRPILLGPFNRVWLLVGTVLGRIMNPIVLSILFFLLLTPLAIFLRLLGRDELRVRNSGKKSFWIDVNEEQNNFNFMTQY